MSIPALRVYAALIGESQMDKTFHLSAPMQRKPVVRTIQRRARLELQDWRESHAQD